MSPLNQTESNNVLTDVTPAEAPVAPADDAVNKVVGQQYWRSVAEYAGSQDFEDKLKDEFEGYNPDELRSMSRRKFMRLCAASMALAGVGLTGCRRWPKEYVVPFSLSPDGTLPGESSLYATVIEKNGVGYGVMATSFDGRPVKLDGNPNHPGSPRGSSDVFTQAATLDLYDPDRPRVVKSAEGGNTSLDWAAFGAYADETLVPMAEAGELAVLAEPSSGLTFGKAKAQLLKKYPKLKWYTWTALHADNSQEATRAAFGKPMRAINKVGAADIVVSFGADLLSDGPDALNAAYGWAKNRKTCDDGKMNRLYVVEQGHTNTGAAADNRLPAATGEQVELVAALAAKLNVAGASAPELAAEQQAFIDAVATDLAGHKGHGLVVAGEQLHPAVQHLVILINEAIGAIGSTVSYVEDPTADDATSVAQIKELSNAIDAGSVKGLLILGGNPAYDAPSDLGFKDKLGKLSAVVHHSQFINETSLLAGWHLPESHFLECWGDARAYGGTVSIQQPLILPLFDSKSRLELVAMLAGATATADVNLGYSLVFENFRSAGLTANVKAWRQALHAGSLEGTAFNAKTTKPKALSGDLPPVEKPSGTKMELNLVGSPVLGDGRYANNGWLQELPQPMTKLTWDNAALMSYASAAHMGLNSGDKISLTLGGMSVIVPVMIVPGTAKDTITLHLGYGRTTVGRVGGQTSSEKVGVDAFVFRQAELQHAVIVAVEKARGKHSLAYTQEHHLLDGVMVNPGLLQQPVEWINQKTMKKRSGEPHKSGYVIKEATLSAYLDNENFVHDKDHGDVHLQLFNAPSPYNTGRHAWGMAIDMGSCTGCNACVVACQAENNIPVVGKDQVLMSREMHWLRIDRYFKGDVKKDEANIKAVHQPVACVHCENAPCEAVCPFAATVHDTEGLNTMVYNRCVGTRYCSNNCPYKVRRYNYFDYHARSGTGDGTNWKKPWLNMPDAEAATTDQVKRLGFNPEVTVRMRGVMEKCSYCTQRISAKKSEKREQWGKLKKLDPKAVFSEMLTDADGLQTACQQACATEAIYFGNLNDPNSKIAKIQSKNPRSYDLLGELNTKPRTKYLARINNPNKALAPAKKTDDHTTGGGHDDHASGGDHVGHDH